MEMTTEVRTASPAVDSEKICPTVEEWVLGMLEEKGMQTLDQLGLSLPSANWAQLFLAVDRLSRAGAITLWSNGRGEYLLNVKQQSEKMAS